MPVGMAACGSCGTTILFGGTKHGGKTYCNATCRSRGLLLQMADQLPSEVVEETVESVFRGNCPSCKGPGPVDVHISYRVYSVILMTSWSSQPRICCRSCAVKNKLVSAVFSATLGWWGFPWGLLATPIQVGRNLAGLVPSQVRDRPSEALRNFIKINIASQLAKASPSQ